MRNRQRATQQPARRAVVTQSFAALCDAIAQVDSPLPDAYRINRHTHAAQVERGTKGDTWVFGELRNAAGYRTALADGWSNATGRIDTLRASIAPSVAAPVDLRRRPVRKSVGDEYCIHTARAGKLDRAWSARERKLVRSRAPIRFIVDVTANAGTGANGFFWRGATALALAQPLTRAGYRVAITGCVATHATYEDGAGYLLALNVKGYGEALDTARLAAVLCSPATLRHLALTLMCHTARDVTTGFGHAIGDEALLAMLAREALLANVAEERFVIPALWSEDSARAYVATISAQFAQEG